MKKRGRPPKPPEYWGDLGGLPLPGRQKKWKLNCGGRPTEFVVGVNLLDACRKFFAKYAALQWRDCRTNELLYKIADANTLRSRVMEAQRLVARAGQGQSTKFNKITYTRTGILNGSFAGERACCDDSEPR